MLHNKFKSKEQTLHFAKGIPMSLNYFIQLQEGVNCILFALGIHWIPKSLYYFTSNLQGRIEFCVSLKEFKEFHGAWIAFVLNLQWRSKLWVSLLDFLNYNKFELLYWKFTRKAQTLHFVIWIQRIPCSLNYFIQNSNGRSKLCISFSEFKEFHWFWIILLDLQRRNNCWVSM